MSPRSTTRAAELQPEDCAEDGADSDTESFKDAVEGELAAYSIASTGQNAEQTAGCLNQILHACMRAAALVKAVSIAQTGERHRSDVQAQVQEPASALSVPRVSQVVYTPMQNETMHHGCLLCKSDNQNVVSKHHAGSTAVKRDLRSAW